MSNKFLFYLLKWICSSHSDPTSSERNLSTRGKNRYPIFLILKFDIFCVEALPRWRNFTESEATVLGPSSSWEHAKFRICTLQLHGGKIPNIQEIYQMALKYTNRSDIISNGHKLYQHISLQDPLKLTQIGISVFKIYHLANHAFSNFNISSFLYIYYKSLFNLPPHTMVGFDLATHEL
jgi:hypothetical protein